MSKFVCCCCCFVVVVVVVITVVVRLEAEPKPTDRRVSVLKLESDIPIHSIGCLRKTNSLSEFQDHPELLGYPHVRKYFCLFVYLFVYLFSLSPIRYPW